MSKKITILGSTGSIGTQALEVLEKLNGKFEVRTEIKEFGISKGQIITIQNFERIDKYKF